MLISFRAKNCFLFDQVVELSMRANGYYTRFPGNVANKDGVQVLKSAIVLGPNNTGKTKLTDAIKAMRDIMLNRPFQLKPSFSATTKVCEIAVSFLAKKPYRFEVHYNAGLREFVFEELAVLESDKEHILYTRDWTGARFYCEDERIRDLLPVLSRDNILIYLLNPSQSGTLEEAKKAIVEFASSIDVIATDRLSIKPTIAALRNEDTRSEIRDFVCNSDPSFQDFFYDENLEVLAQYLPSLFSEEAQPSTQIIHHIRRGPCPGQPAGVTGGCFQIQTVLVVGTGMCEQFGWPEAA